MNRIDRQIKAVSVLVIGENGEKLGVHPIGDALRMAADAKLNLVEISPNVNPPVVKIMNYGKFLFEQKKQKNPQKNPKVKEIKFRPGTGKADYEVKLRNLRGFLEEGDKARVSVVFRGREMAHLELGMALLERVKADLDDCSKVEFFPRSAEGRQLVMVLAPKKK